MVTAQPRRVPSSPRGLPRLRDLVDRRFALWALGWLWIADTRVCLDVVGVSLRGLCRVASKPTISRTIDALAADVERALAAIDTAHAWVWALAGEHAPNHRASAGHPVLGTWTPPSSSRTRRNKTPAPTYNQGPGKVVR